MKELSRHLERIEARVRAAQRLDADIVAALDELAEQVGEAAVRQFLARFAQAHGLPMGEDTPCC